MKELLKRILNGESVRQVLDESGSLEEKKITGTGKRINYEDDLVRVFDKDGNEVYSGMEDYEPMKDEDWKFDKDLGAYRLDDFIKVCI